MRLRIPVVIAVWVACFVFISGLSAEAKEPLKLSLAFDKQEYKQKEPISVTFTLKNQSKKPVYVNQRFHIGPQNSPKRDKEIYFRVISPSGEELPFKEKAFYGTGFPKSDYFICLEKGEKVTSERKKNLTAYFDFNEPGTYEIKAFYQNSYGDEIGLDTCKKEIDSGFYKIKITE